MTSAHSAMSVRSRRRSRRGLRSRAWWRLPRAGEDRGSMPMLMLVILIGVSLSALLIPIIITQDRATRFDTSRVQALDAAQAGLDVALGRIRAAVGTDGLLAFTALPCTSITPITGNVTSPPVTGTAADPGPATYSVTIAYFASPGQSVSCGSGLPTSAQVTSTGTTGTAVNGSTKGRTLSTTYVFRTSNTRLRGGVIQLSPASAVSTPLCMDAGSATPTLPFALTMAACSRTTPATSQQVFAYRPDLTVQLVSSVTSTYPNGLCLDTAAVPTAGNNVVFSQCVAAGVTPPYTQQWSLNSYGEFQASVSTSATSSQINGILSNLCMSVAGQVAPVPGVSLATCVNSINAQESWLPAASVGSGGVTAPQLVNYREANACLDLRSQNVNGDHLVDFPCTQNPYAGAVPWDQKFTMPALSTSQTVVPGRIVTTPSSGTNYCLTSPGAGTAPRYVTFTACSTPLPAQNWTVYGGDDSLSYTLKYTIHDNSTPSLCLGLAAPYGTETWSSVVVEPCTGASDQKWDAANLSPPLQNTKEN